MALTKPLEKFVNTRQAAAIIGCSTGHVRYMLIHGWMEGQKVSERTWLIPIREAKRISNNRHEHGRPRGARSKKSG